MFGARVGVRSFLVAAQVVTPQKSHTAYRESNRTEKPKAVIVSIGSHSIVGSPIAENHVAVMKEAAKTLEYQGYEVYFRSGGTGHFEMKDNNFIKLSRMGNAIKVAIDLRREDGKLREYEACLPGEARGFESKQETFPYKNWGFFSTHYNSFFDRQQGVLFGGHPKTQQAPYTIVCLSQGGTGTLFELFQATTAATMKSRELTANKDEFGIWQKSKIGFDGPAKHGEIPTLRIACVTEPGEADFCNKLKEMFQLMHEKRLVRYELDVVNTPEEMKSLLSEEAFQFKK